MRARYFYGWTIVGCAFAIAVFGWGLGFYGPGIYIARLNREHGWSIATLSAAVTLYYVGSACFVIFTGDIMGRFGPRRVVLAGSALLAAGVIALTLTAAPWQVFACFLLMSAGCAATTGAAIQAIIAPWFIRKRGLATSLALNGSSCGGMLIAPLLLFLIERFGFTTGSAMTTALLLAVLWPLVAIFLVHRPRDLGLLPDGAPPDDARTPPATADSGTLLPRAALLRDPLFHTISLPFALGLAAQVGFLMHQVSFLLPTLGTDQTAWYVGLTTACAVAGRLIAGTFIDAVNVRLASAGNFAIQIAGLLLLLATDRTAAVFVACALFGLGVGNLITFPALIVQREYPAAHFTRIVSLLVAINQLTFAFGPGILGLSRDWSGSYRASLLVCVSLQLAAILIVLAGTRRTSRAAA